MGGDSQAPGHSDQRSHHTVHVLSHPLIQHKLTYMRDVRTGMAPFRQLLKEISLLMGYEVTRHLAVETLQVTTPLAVTAGVRLGPESVAIVPVLRAGLGMVEGLLELMPFAQVGHIGLFRDPETKMPVDYLVRLPDVKEQMFIVADPMLATGHSAVRAVQILCDHGVPCARILLMSLVASPEGAQTFQAAFPEIPIFTAALDEKLDDDAYIVPGLGDAGDRLFGTGACL